MRGDRTGAREREIGRTPEQTVDIVHLTAVRRFLTRRMNRDVDDVLQQTMLVFLENAPRFRAESSLQTFLIGIARNEMRVEKRRRARRECTSLEGPQLEAPGHPFETLAEAGDLGATLAQLDPGVQEVLRLLYWESLSQAAIAKRLCIPRGTVASRLRRAKRDLRRHLDPALSSLETTEKFRAPK